MLVERNHGEEGEVCMSRHVIENGNLTVATLVNARSTRVRRHIGIENNEGD
jgi:hypothetical protein